MITKVFEEDKYIKLLDVLNFAEDIKSGFFVLLGRVYIQRYFYNRMLREAETLTESRNFYDFTEDLFNYHVHYGKPVADLSSKFNNGNWVSGSLDGRDLDYFKRRIAEIKLDLARPQSTIFEVDFY